MASKIRIEKEEKGNVQFSSGLTLKIASASKV